MKRIMATFDPGKLRGNHLVATITRSPERLLKGTTRLGESQGQP
jgi:hypothetical protein